MRIDDSMRRVSTPRSQSYATKIWITICPSPQSISIVNMRVIDYLHGWNWFCNPGADAGTQAEAGKVGVAAADDAETDNAAGADNAAIAD